MTKWVCEGQSVPYLGVQYTLFQYFPIFAISAVIRHSACQSTTRGNLNESFRESSIN